MTDLLTTPVPDAVGYVAFVLYMALEFWLGKTDKVKSGSAAEVALKGVKSVLGAIKKTPKLPTQQPPEK